MSTFFWKRSQFVPICDIWGYFGRCFWAIQESTTFVYLLMTWTYARHLGCEHGLENRRYFSHFG